MPGICVRDRLEILLRPKLKAFLNFPPQKIVAIRTLDMPERIAKEVNTQFQVTISSKKKKQAIKSILQVVVMGVGKYDDNNVIRQCLSYVSSFLTSPSSVGFQLIAKRS